MSVGYIFSLLNTTVYKKILVLFYIIMLIPSINPANGAVGDILINNENKLLESGKSWTLFEGYEVTVTALDDERVKISLSKDGKEVHLKGEFRNYSYEYRNPTNISQLILRFRVIYINRTEIQLGNIIQISDGSLLSIPTPTPTSNATTNITNPGVSAGEISKEGLVGEWHFDGDAKDLSGNGNDGTIYGAAFVDGISGKALSFDGVNDYVEVHRSSILDINGKLLSDYTIELWFKTPCQNCGIFSIVGGSSTPPSPAHDRHIYLKNGNLCQRIWNTQTICTSDTNYADSNWHHVAQNVQKGIGQKIFVDGVQKVSGTKDISDNIWADKIWIGFSDDASFDYFNGIIDEVRIYNRTLSPDEIKVQYASTSGTSAVTAAIKPTPSPYGEIIGTDSFFDDFNGSTLSSGWIVINKNSDSNIFLTGTGILRMNASPMNGGSDYYNRSNYNALRILKSLSNLFLY